MLFSLRAKISDYLTSTVEIEDWLYDQAVSSFRSRLTNYIRIAREQNSENVQFWRDRIERARPDTSAWSIDYLLSLYLPSDMALSERDKIRKSAISQLRKIACPESGLRYDWGSVSLRYEYLSDRMVDSGMCRMVESDSRYGAREHLVVTPEFLSSLGYETS